MATLYVENVPDELYEALRTRAQGNRKSIAAEVLKLLQENIPTRSELERRKKILARIRKRNSASPETAGPFPTVEEMLRQDRDR
jgi:plasmid stability protein